MYFVFVMVEQFLMVFQDVAFQPSEASFFTTFLKNCGRDENLWTTTCLTTLVGVRKGIFPVK